MKILEVHADGDLITHVRYYAEKNGVDTEGYCYLVEPKLTISFSDVTEDMVIGWVKDQFGTEKVTEIEAALQLRIDEQHQPTKATGLPWQ
mgnify:CR=1 FL=1